MNSGKDPRGYDSPPTVTSWEQAHFITLAPPSPYRGDQEDPLGYLPRFSKPSLWEGAAVPQGVQGRSPS